MTEPSSYRVRLLFRVRRRLNIAAPSHQFGVADHEVVLSSSSSDLDIRESSWLILNARNFISEQEAQKFAIKLKAAVELSSVATRLGIDTGRDATTSWLAPHLRDQIAQSTGLIFRNAVHGLDIFPDDSRIRFVSRSARAIDLANPNAFLSAMDELHSSWKAISTETNDIVLLLNYALMRTDPVAQIVFTFSAVEMIGQRERWTANQKALLRLLAKSADDSGLCSKEERQEVSDAIQKSVHRLTLRQGVLRLLSRLGLSYLNAEWDRLYAERSKLVHGLAPRPGVDYSSLAHEALTLCGHILLKMVAEQQPLTAKYLATFYDKK